MLQTPVQNGQWESVRSTIRIRAAEVLRSSPHLREIVDADVAAFEADEPKTFDDIIRKTQETTDIIRNWASLEDSDRRKRIADRLQSR